MVSFAQTNLYVQVLLSPATATVNQGATTLLASTVNVYGMAATAQNTALAWTVDGVTNGNTTVGYLTGSGTTRTYVAPAAAGTHTVKVTDIMYPWRNASTTITVQAPVVVYKSLLVSLSPSTATLYTKGTKLITSTITLQGMTATAENSVLNWTVDGVANGNATVGTLTGTGVSRTYTAPVTAGTHTITATDAMYPWRFASSTMTVQTAPSTAVAISASPSSASVAAGASQSFAASVSGTTNTAVTWTVDGVTNGNSTVGTVSGTGNAITYKAPAVAGNHTLRAISAADTSKVATASISVTAPQPAPAVSVALSPLTSVLNYGGKQSFTATVSGSTNTGITWLVDNIQNGNSTVGTAIGTGDTVIYTAPSATGSHTLTAQSAADTSKVATAAVTVQAGCAPSPTSSATFNVKNYGATGNGVTDDTNAIQSAINAATGTGGTVLIPDGTYMINATANGYMGVLVKSNLTLSMSSNAILKAIPNASGTYSILGVSNASNVNIIGGTLLGDRSTHTGSGGEWGMGLTINASNHVYVQGTNAKECWGDGFYVENLSSTITLCGVTGDHNRRQGLSIVGVDGLTVSNSTFRNTTGTPPEAGIDIEPNEACIVNHTLITGCTLTNNAGGGVQIGFPDSFTQARIYNAVVDNNYISGNGVNPYNGGYRAAVCVNHCIGNATVQNNTIINNPGEGIMLMDHSASTIVKGNTVTGTTLVNGNTTWTGGGIYISASPYSSVTSNTVKNNQGHGIWLCDGDTTVVISSNTVSGNGVTP